MADKKSEEEPSIEEILASIRQIISDDEEDDAEEEQVVESPIHQDSDDILELTEEDLVEDEPEETIQAPIEIDLRDRESEIEEDIIDDEEDFEEDDEPEEPVFEDDPRSIIEQIRAQTAQERNTMPSDILSSAAQSAAMSSLSKLRSKMPINNPRSYDGITLEDIVREMLNPMLREWMDDNLPPMVERIVQKELEKLARRAFDD